MQLSALGYAINQENDDEAGYIVAIISRDRRLTGHIIGLSLNGFTQIVVVQKTRTIATLSITSVSKYI